MARRNRSGGWATRALGLFLLAAVACGGQPDAPATAPADTTTAPAAAAATAPPDTTSPRVPTFGFWPDLDAATVAWFAAIVTLALLLRLTPPRIIGRNFDAVVLAGMCLLLLLRLRMDAPVEDGRPWQWWAYTAFAIIAVYWIVRGIVTLLSRQGPQFTSSLSSGALAILMLAGVGLCVQRIATAPIERGSQDAVVGALYLLDEGQLPYGDLSVHDRRSPLLYAAQAGALVLMPAETHFVPGGEVVPMRWNNSANWLQADWVTDGNLEAIRLLNATLFVLLLIAMYLLGYRLHSPAGGWAMIAVFCVFPGTHECLNRPEIMLPTCLLTWAVVLALIPRVGGLLGTLMLMAAAVAWPWALLALPIFLAFFFRRGWQALGSLIGLGAGVALILGGIVQYVPPTLPRDTGVLRMAGEEPTWSASSIEEDTLHMTRADEPALDGKAPLTRYFWRMLLRQDNVAMRPDGPAAHALTIDWPLDVNGDRVLFREVAATGAARESLNEAYRAAAADRAWWPRLCIGTRTLLEQTWLAHQPPVPAVPSIWAIWGAASDSLLSTRRLVKLGAGVLVLWATLAIFLGRRAQPRHLLGGMLIVTSGTLMASAAGPVTNFVWVLPMALALSGVYESRDPTLPAGQAARRPVPGGAPAGAPERIATPLDQPRLTRGEEPRITSE